MEMILGHQMNDLRAAQSYLDKQRHWLDSAVVAPGLLVESESSTVDAHVVGQVKLVDGGDPAPISYARLAAALRLAASDAQWIGKYPIAVATSKVNLPVSQMVENPLMLLRVHFRHNILPWLAKSAGIAAIGVGVGYVLGTRDQGSWALRTLGWNVRG